MLPNPVGNIVGLSPVTAAQLSSNPPRSTRKTDGGGLPPSEFRNPWFVRARTEVSQRDTLGAVFGGTTVRAVGQRPFSAQARREKDLK